jgi:outer membrane receptor protein involved in Fe transport
VTTEARDNRDAIVVDQKAMDNLPMFDRDIVGTLSRFLDSGSIGTSGVTLIVDGMEAKSIGVSPSAIQQVKINSDPYAAEFARPGRGRVEVITKSGTDAYHGSGDFTFRDAALNARDPFAVTRAPEQRRISEGFLGGPLLNGKTTSFMTTIERREEDLQSVVFAVDPSGTVRANVPRPRRELQVSATINHQQGDRNTISIRYTHEGQDTRNQGVGGTTLAEAASADVSHENQVVWGQRTIVSKKLLSEFRILAGAEVQTTASANRNPRIVVLDAFTGGGAQNDRLQTEHHIQLTEALTYATTKHLVKFGVNVPDWSRRRNDDLTNTAGTFMFSTLQDYVLGRPLSFVQQRGDGHLVFLQKVIGGFVQDQITLRPNLSVSLGLRYDWQNYFPDYNDFSPRAAFAFAPGENRTTVIRGGAGVFYDRAGEGPISDLLHSSQGRLFRYVVLDPAYPDPFRAGSLQAATPPSIVRLAPDASMPYTVQYSVGVERQLRKGTTLAVNYVGARGIDMFRSRDVNAPPPPLYLTRPDPTYGVVREIESAGRQHSDSVQTTLRGRVSRFFNGSIQYTLGRVYNDTGGINSLPANNYDLSGEWSRADFDQRHRFDLLGAFKVAELFDLGVGLSLYSGRPYSLRTGVDAFNTGQTNARPAGVARNTLEGPRYANLDLRWSRDIFVHKRKGEEERALTVGLDAFNVTNRVNYNNVVGNISSPLFGRAVSAQPPRRLQLSIHARF